jgi:mannitol/fructose-specific phosphotransferase system IIA component (Ntr-type)
MTLAQYTEPRLLVPRLLSDDRPSAITELSLRLEKTGRIANADAFKPAVLEHESVVSIVFEEVAFPLARDHAIRELSFALGVSPQGIRWGSGRAPTAHAVVLFAVPLSAGQPYLSLLAAFAKSLQNETLLSSLHRCGQPEQMFAALNAVCVRQTSPQLVATQP